MGRRSLALHDIVKRPFPTHGPSRRCVSPDRFSAWDKDVLVIPLFEIGLVSDAAIDVCSTQLDVFIE